MKSRGQRTQSVLEDKWETSVKSRRQTTQSVVRDKWDKRTQMKDKCETMRAENSKCTGRQVGDTGTQSVMGDRRKTSGRHM